jgi:hypothetical protein
MTNGIMPALTAAEWHEAVLGGPIDLGEGFLVEVEHDSLRLLVQPNSGGGVFEVVRTAALAAMSLRAGSGPYLTWDHVRTLRNAADALPRGQAVRQGVLDVVDRIVALLPPAHM